MMFVHDCHQLASKLHIHIVTGQEEDIMFFVGSKFAKLDNQSVITSLFRSRGQRGKEVFMYRFSLFCSQNFTTNSSGIKFIALTEIYLFRS